MGLQVLAQFGYSTYYKDGYLSLNSSSAADPRDSGKSEMSLQDGGDHDGVGIPLLGSFWVGWGDQPISGYAGVHGIMVLRK